MTTTRQDRDEEMASMSDLRLYLLGTPRLEFQGQVVKIERRKAFALAAYLALAEQRQSRTTVSYLLWSDLDNEHGLSALRSTLRALTMPIALEWIQADRTSLALKPNITWVDVNVFTSLLSRIASHNHSQNFFCDECIDLCLQAIDLYRSDFMTGFDLSDSVEYDDWQLAQREWLRREFTYINQKLSHHYTQTEEYDQAFKYARRWLALDLLHEPAHRQLMRLYAASGQRSQALRQYNHCVEVLNTELATIPEIETTHLYQSIQNEHFVPGQRFGAEISLSTSLMPPLPPLFIGREEVLHDIKLRLGIGSKEIRAVTVIQGWPGVGKSTTVAMLAHDPQLALQFPDGILWASLGENPDIPGEITTWLEALHLGEPGRVRKPADASAQITTALRDRRMLLILDDVWQAKHAVPFRVGGQLCALVVTSRLNDVASSLAPTAHDIYRLPVLSEAAGFELLGKLTPQTVMQHPDETRELISNLEGLPLAIHVAGRLLQSEAQFGWGVKELLVELRTGAALLQAQTPSDMMGVGRDVSLTITALLARSTDLLDVEIRHHFATLGLFAPKPATFDLDAMRVAWNVKDPRPTARTLVNRGLLEPVNGGRFQLHALLVMHARSLLTSAGYHV